MFVAVLALLSTVPYLARLGFYSDDWNYLADLVTSPAQSLGALLARHWEHVPYDVRMRPLHLTYQVGLYSVSGTNPFGYHAANAIVLASMAAALHRVLSGLGLPRALALSIAAVYALLPNYSAVRFMVAAYGYALTATLCLLSLAAERHAVRSSGWSLATWKAAALALLVAAGLGVELFLPILAFGPVLGWYASKHRQADGGLARLRGARYITYVGSHLAVLLVIVAFKSAHARQAVRWPDWRHVLDVLAVAAGPNLGSFGIGLPWTVAWSLPRLSGLALVIAGLVALASFVYVRAILRADGQPLSPANRRRWVQLTFAGLAVLALGYVVFLTNTRFSFTSTGHGNRTALAGSIGVAIIFVAIAAWVSSLLRSVRARTNVFAGLMGVLCFAGTAVVNALAEDQVTAAVAQRRVLSDMQRAVAAWPSGSTVILHGYCPYSGTAIVFERSDFEGALRVLYRDDTLVGDVGSRLELEDGALVTTAVGQRGVYRVRTTALRVRWPWPTSGTACRSRRSGRPLRWTSRGLAEHVRARRA